MKELASSQRKSILISGLQMAVIGIIFKLGITVLTFLAIIQFFWMLFTQDKNKLIANLGASLKIWFGGATEFLLGTSDTKPFPWAEME